MCTKLQLCILLVGWLAIGSILAARPSRKGADMSLLQFMRETRDIQQNDPMRTISCFSYYSDIFDQQYDEFEREYGACIKKADARKNDTDDFYAPIRIETESIIQDACELLGNCASSSRSRDAFACYSNAASYNTKVMFNISTNASAVYAEIEEDYRVIGVEQDKCTNASSVRYVEITANTYDDLQDCLSGLKPVPTTSTAAPSTASTSSSPTTPTPTPVASTTKSPESSSTVDPIPTAPLRTTASQESQFGRKRNAQKDMASILANLRNHWLH